MREKKWKPGPWKPKCGSSVQIGNDWWFASNQTLSCVEVGKRSVTREANAALISAAPELLEACEFLSEVIGNMANAIRTGVPWDMGDIDKRGAKADAAIAKAYGESDS